MKEVVKFDFDNPPMREETIFWNETDPRWGGDGNNHEVNRGTGRVLDMQNESYVWGFAGPRRAGKTSYMTYIALKAAYLYDKRIISNYPISLDVRYRDLTVKHIRSENLDLGKLLQFDGAYTDALIVLDEAPQIINRLATMTWKNRLLDLYLQKLGHDNISMLYGSQNESIDHGWVDGALRFQTDILVFCRDAAIRYPGAGYKRGSMVLANLLDKSGAWTGYRYEERPRVYKRRILTELIWGCFDTHQRFDVFESLRRVSMNLDRYEITDKEKGDNLQSSIEKVKQVLGEGIAKGKMKVSDFYNNIGDIGQGEKNAIGRMLTHMGAQRRGAHYSVFDFSNIDINALKGAKE